MKMRQCSFYQVWFSAVQCIYINWTLSKFSLIFTLSWAFWGLFLTGNTKWRHCNFSYCMTLWSSAFCWALGECLANTFLLWQDFIGTVNIYYMPWQQKDRKVVKFSPCDNGCKNECYYVTLSYTTRYSFFAIFFFNCWQVFFVVHSTI